MKSDPGIPASDRVEVYNHLAGHFEQFGKVAPDLKVLKLMWSIGDSIKVLRSESFITDRFDVPAVLCQLSDIDALIRAEPVTVDPDLLTQEKLFRELAIRQRQMVLKSLQGV